MNTQLKHIFFAAAIAIMTIAAFVSCDKEEVAVEPTLGEIVFDKNPCHAGDTVVAKVTYQTKGKYCTFSDKLTTFDGLPTNNILFKYNGTGADEPFCTFVVADTIGTFTVKFKGQMEYFAGKNLWGSVKNTRGTLKVE